MSRNPFGSIFGKIIEPKDVKAEKEAEAAAQAAAQTAPTSTPASAPPPEVRKEPFDRTTSQFKASTDVEPKDPHVLLEASRLNRVQKEADLDNLTQKIVNLKMKISSITFYRNLLLTFSELSTTKKSEISSWIKANSLAIANIIKARDLQKLTDKTVATNDELDTQIAHLTNLLQLKNEGINVMGTTTLRYYQPSKPFVKADPPSKGPIPIIQGKSAINQLFSLSKLGLGQAADYYQAFKAQQPSNQSYFDKHKYAYQESNIPKETEKNVLYAMQMTWQAKDLAKEYGDITQKYQELQTNIRDILDKLHGADPAFEVITTTLAVLLDLKPEKFQGTDILSGLKASVSEVSQLGDAADLPTVMQTQNLVDQSAADAAIATQEQEAKTATVAQLEAQLTGGPPPPPAPIVVAPVEEAPKKTILKLLPWVVGAFILFKLME